MPRQPCAWPDCLALCDVREQFCSEHWGQLPPKTRRELSGTAGARRSAIIALTKATDADAPAAELRRLQTVYREAAAADEQAKAAIVAALEENRRADA